ncbi:MAG: adenylyl-sulfate kinase [Patescibacteria group bacterium]|jgi:adenylylsulfate kinase
MASHIKWHGGTVQRSHGRIIWLTGLSGSGKSTLAVALEQHLFDQGKLVYRLDGDNIRHGLNKDLGFSAADRVENIRRIGEVSKLFVAAGVTVITAFISPYQADRDLVRQLVKPGEFIEVFVNCPLEICEQRDVKGLYAQARAGEIKDFTGVNAPYEVPTHPEVVINTEKQSIDQALQQLVLCLNI